MSGSNSQDKSLYVDYYSQKRNGITQLEADLKLIQPFTGFLLELRYCYKDVINTATENLYDHEWANASARLEPPT